MVFGVAESESGIRFTPSGQILKVPPYRAAQAVYAKIRTDSANLTSDSDSATPKTLKIVNYNFFSHAIFLLWTIENSNFS